MEIRDGRLYYDAGYSRFEDYCKERWEWSKTHVNRQIEAARVATELTPMGVIPNTERQARELARLKEPEQVRSVRTCDHKKAPGRGDLRARIGVRLSEL